MSETYTLFFDGCSKGNPGRAGAGAVIYRNQIEIFHQSSFVDDKASNNVAEYHGLLLGMHKAVELKVKQLRIKGDSLLVINQLKGDFKVNAPSLKPLYNKAKILERQLGSVTYEHVYREYNKRADALANDALANDALANDAL